MSAGLKEKVFSGLLWRGCERFGTQAVSFVVSVVMARLLAPRDFGTIALLTVFIAVARVFVDSGFGTALVQKKAVDERDYNTVFYLGLAASGLLYLVLFLAAPAIAGFYREPVLIEILRLLSLTLILGALTTVQTAVLNREMRFKLTFKVSLCGLLVSAALGIGLARAGFGVWSLVWSQLAGMACSTVALWAAVGWRPRLAFSFGSARALFSYSSKLLCSGVLDTLFTNIYSLTIGKFFNATVLGYYNRGQGFPTLLVGSVNGTISGVMFPALAACQDDRARVKVMARRMMVTCCFLVFPMMAGLAAVAKPLVVLLLTEKWLPCVPYLQLSCIAFAFWPLHVANLQIVMALGRSDLFLKLEVIKKGLTLIVLVATIPAGVLAMVAGQAAVSLVCVVINAWPNGALIHYPVREQLRDIAPFALVAAIMGGIVLALQWGIAGPGRLLAAQMVCGLLVYVGGCRLSRTDSLSYLWGIAGRVVGPRLMRLVGAGRS